MTHKPARAKARKPWRGVFFPGTTKEWDVVMPRDKHALASMRETEGAYECYVVPIEHLAKSTGAKKGKK